jgi:hypothetical protein
VCGITGSVLVVQAFGEPPDADHPAGVQQQHRQQCAQPRPSHGDQVTVGGPHLYRAQDTEQHDSNCRARTRDLAALLHRAQPGQLLRVAVGLGFRRGRLQHVYSLLRGKDLETGIISPERREEQFAILREAQDYVVDLTNWHEFLKCLTRAGFRSSRMISSENALLYTYALCWSAGETSASTCPGCGR